MILTITLPLPPRILSPNARPHHHAKARAVKAARCAAKLECMALLPAGYKPRFPKGTAQVEWIAKTRVHPDGDNALATCKAVFDGITDSGFLADDKELTHQPVRFGVDKANPRLVVTITVP